MPSDLRRSVRELCSGTTVTSNVAEGLDPEAFNQTLMTERITSDLLRGWGADDEAVDRAFRTSDAMFERGLLFPEVIG